MKKLFGLAKAALAASIGVGIYLLYCMFMNERPDRSVWMSIFATGFLLFAIKFRRPSD